MNIEVDMNKLNEIWKYLRKRDEYYANALKYFSEKNFSKASGLLWGAIIQLSTHADFFKFIRQLAKELNFYDEVINPQDFERYLKKAVIFLKK